MPLHIFPKLSMSAQQAYQCIKPTPQGTNNNCYVVLLSIARPDVHLLFQAEICPFPQEGYEENTEERDSHRHGLIEMGTL
jgi:hypothetical protein